MTLPSCRSSASLLSPPVTPVRGEGGVGVEDETPQGPAGRRHDVGGTEGGGVRDERGRFSTNIVQS